MVRNGQADGLQRYKCRGCGRRFNALSGTPLARVAISTDGKLVTDYQITAASGTDYRDSFVPSADVPEPASLALFALGGMALAYRRRARGKRD